MATPVYFELMLERLKRYNLFSIISKIVTVVVMAEVGILRINIISIIHTVVSSLCYSASNYYI